MYTFEFDTLPSPVNMNSPGVSRQRHRRAVGIHGLVKDMLDGRTDLPDTPLDQVELHFLFYLPNLIARDLENLRASCKPYVDGLVKCGILADDNMKVVRRDVQDWKHRKNDPGFTILVVPRGERCMICADGF